MATKKTDNSFFLEKVALRQKFLPPKKNITVLECFSGYGKLWSEIIKNNPDKTINLIKIDTNPRDNLTLKGNNIKYLSTLKLSSFDIIDLDAYGIPFEQCQIIFKRKFSGIIHITAIQSMFGMLNQEMLEILGFSKTMITKCRSLFNKNGIDKFLQYLALNNITEITYLQPNHKKFYGTFKIKKNE